MSFAPCGYTGGFAGRLTCRLHNINDIHTNIIQYNKVRYVKRNHGNENIENRKRSIGENLKMNSKVPGSRVVLGVL